METYAIIENDIVKNIVIADDENFFAIAYPSSIVIKITELTGQANIGVEFISGKFMPVKPWDSWVFNQESWAWAAPNSYPSDGLDYIWDEAKTKWALVSFEEPLPLAE